MRLWMVNPELMCRQHLLGEHRECHSLAGMIAKDRRIRGTKYVTTGLVEVHSIKSRHDELEREMINRGYHPVKPFPDVLFWTEGEVDRRANIQELHRRCPECRKRIKNISEIEI